jgi:hypothetical protein
VVAHATLSSQPGKIVAKIGQPAVSAAAPMSVPADLGLEQLAGQAGAVSIPGNDAQSLFPALTDAIGASGVKALLASSQIVGMARPGLHSLFAGLDIAFDPKGGQEAALGYAVTKVDAGFRSLQIDISGSGAAGRLDAFSRPAPPSQPGMTEISACITGSPFAGQRSLVIGGSRGLGEVTAKIVAADGGRPVITYKESARG